MKSVVSHQDDHKLQRCWNWWNGLTLLPFRVSRWVTAIQSRSNKGTINNVCIFRGQRMSNCFGLWLFLPPGAPSPFPFPFHLPSGLDCWARTRCVCRWRVSPRCVPSAIIHRLLKQQSSSLPALISVSTVDILQELDIITGHNSSIALFSSGCSRNCSQKKQCSPKNFFSYITQHKKKHL